jgi:EmrB/QacA subfamily drug resistance transporter
VTTVQRHVLRSWGGPVQTSNRIAHGYRRWAFATSLIVMFTAAVSSTIASAAEPTVVADLGGFSIYGWVVTSYLLASAVGVSVSGKLSDAYGRRPLYVLALACFGLGTLLAALAPTMWFLVAARALSGFGGGGMMTLSAATIGDVFSPRDRGRWLGVVMAVFGLSAIVGPTLGGAITDGLGWRWVFAFPAPLALAAFLIAGAVMPRVRTEAAGKPDLAGAGLLAGGILGVLLAVTWGGTTYAWGSAQILVCAAGGAALLGGLVWHERRSPNAMLPRQLFRSRAFALGSTINFVNVGLMYVVLTTIPLYVQGVLGQSPGDSGLVLTPTLVSFSVAATLTGQIASRTGRYRPQLILGALLVLAGYTLMSRLTATSTNEQVVVGQIVCGAGMGLMQPAISLSIQSAFPHGMLGTANAGRQLFANLGSAVMVPLMTAIVVTRFDHELTRSAPEALGGHALRGRLLPEQLITSEAQAAARSHFVGEPGVYRHYVQAVRDALATGIADVFMVGIGLALVAFVLCVIYPRVEIGAWDEHA